LLEDDSPADAIREAIRPSRYPGIDLIPANTSLAECTAALANERGREQRLRNALATIADPYDWMIVDAPPAMSLVTVNCIHSVDELLCPVDAGAYAIMGLARLQETVDSIRKHLAHPDLQIIGLLLTRVMKNRATRELETQLRETYGPLVYKTSIPYATQVAIAEAHHLTVLEHAPKSPAAVAFEALITEVLGNHGRKSVDAAKSRRQHVGNRKKRAG
jgi:chromosome partitioning protein